MDLRDSSSEAAFRAEARAFLEAHRPEIWFDYFDEETDEEAYVATARQWQRTQHEHGWTALLWPREFGGRGLGPIEQIIWNQEQSRAGLHESLFVAGIGLAGPTLIAHGTDAQRERHLQPLLRGDEVWCQLFSEPSAGSDLAAVGTRAVRDGDSWVVTGQKVWSTGAQFSDWGMLIARSDPGVPKHEGITYLLVDMRAPGVEVRPLRDMTGGEHFNEVFLSGVRVPDANRVGPVHGGWKVARTTLLNERMAMGGLELTYPWAALAEHARGQRARLDVVTRQRLVRLYERQRALELLNARIMTKLGRGQIPDSESSIMKLCISRVATLHTQIALDLLGPAGALRRGPWQNLFLYAPAMRIGGGTDEIQRNIVAERVLGLPREPAADADVPFDQIRR